MTSDAASGHGMSSRVAGREDFDALYALGLETPEFRVADGHPFMEPDEFLSAIQNPYGLMLVAETNGEIAGFVYANRAPSDMETAPRSRWACIVYVVVREKYRQRGIAKELYHACVAGLKEKGATHVYAWAAEGGGVIGFLKKQGFEEGHSYIWMEKKI